MSRTIIVVGAVVVVALAVALGVFRGEADPPAATAPVAPGVDPAETIRLLREELREEQGKHATLVGRIEQLEAQLAATQTREIEVPESDDEPPSEASPSDFPGAGDEFPEERLLAQGFSLGEVQAYRERLDQIHLERLYLRDRAARKGWANTPRFSREARELYYAALQETRDEFGDELHDWALFASGHPNRVKVSSVMEGSAAAVAGIEVGDVVVRYDDRTIFNLIELREETTAGRPGQNTAVEIVRDGEVRRVFLPRGPLGIRTEMIVKEPSG